ncbi:hypothetical protein, partial [Ruegeria sp. 6PALISEP08]|uniref:hypothetical protein n=1 Tax=Ruegeria sp. 6PALISEP08 TaxID=1225660 RepID=UPI001C0F5AF1
AVRHLKTGSEGLGANGCSFRYQTLVYLRSMTAMRTNLPSASFFSLSASCVRPTSTLSLKKGMVLLLPFGAKKDVFAPTDGFATC